MKVSKTLSSTLMIANLFAMIFVIAIHYNSRHVANISEWNYFIQEFLVNGVARIAVPFFALISGFFLYKNVESMHGYIVMLQKKVRTLFLPYLFGSTLLIIMTMFLVFISLSNKTFEWSFNSIIEVIFLHPVAEQYWFLRDLIVLTIISPVVFVKQKVLNVLLGIALLLLWWINIQPFPIVAGWYLINTEVLFFFWLGGNLYARKNILYAIVESEKPMKWMFFMGWVLLILFRLFVDPSLDVWYVSNYNIQGLLVYKLAILVGVVSLIQVAASFKDSSRLLYLSGFTFFVYLFHLAPITYILHMLPYGLRGGEFSFYIRFPLATVMVFLLAYIVSKYFTTIYQLITGGRTPEKAIKRLADN